MDNDQTKGKGAITAQDELFSEVRAAIDSSATLRVLYKRACVPWLRRMTKPGG